MRTKQFIMLGVGLVVGIGLALFATSFMSNRNNTQNLITSDKAKTIVMNQVPGATLNELLYDNSNEVPSYEAKLTKDDSEYEIDINAKTGDILKFKEVKIVTENNSTASNNTQTNTTSNSTQNTTNKSTASNNTSKNTTTNKNNISNNSTTNNTNNNTTTNKGNTTNKPATNNTSSYISSQKAKSIMLNKVPGATITSFNFDRDGVAEYEAELRKGNYEYDISVDARTGAIREFSKDRIDADDKYDD